MRDWRVFASLLGLCLDQPWLGQSPKVCACMACWNVYPARSKDVGAVAGLGADNVDGWLGDTWLYFCTLWNVETPPRSECEFKSTGPKIAAAGVSAGNG